MLFFIKPCALKIYVAVFIVEVILLGAAPLKVRAPPARTMHRRDILVLDHIGLDLLTKRVKLGLQIVCGTMGDGFLVSENLFWNPRSIGAGVQRIRPDERGTLCHHLVTLARKHVEHCLCADNLGSRRDKRRIACVFARAALR